ncbi:hypothetical protein [Luteolibacter sp. Populi]|uniref:hypothetical protein n=1 Tax=Luteolibacter sp. Populi TaxID=3230487 RepID=UPI0034672098
MKQRATVEISLDAAGFTTTRGTRVDWAEVGEIVASKEDLFSVDEICVGFRYADSDDYQCVDESDAGYKELLAALELNFPGIKTDWFSDVAFPAFETNWTVLWSKTAQVQS